ncbi:hypothetical protein [Amycolatopsis sp. NPDC003731]
MPLPPLATPADGVTYGYPEVSPALYARASVRVRSFVEQDITRATSTLTLSGCGPWYLPQRPVVAVTSVVNSVGDAVAFYVDGAWLYADPRHPSGYPLTVTYTHGFDPVPDALVELVCAVATRMSSVPDAVASGVRTEQAGAEAVTWGVEAYNASSGLTSTEEARLRRMFPKLPRTITMRPAPIRGF